MTSNDLVMKVVLALEGAGIPYMLVGSYSSNAFGIPRATNDADFVIETGDRPLAPLFDALQPDVQFDPQMQVEMVTMTYRYVGRHANTGFKIELFLVSDDPHDQARFGRRQSQPFLNGRAVLPTPEDVVVQKLRWAARAGRDKDRQDAMNVLAVQAAHLDLQYVRDWSDKLGIRQLLDDLLNDIATRAGKPQ